MARKERVVIDRLNGASEVQQIHDRPVSKKTAIFSAQTARVSRVRDSDSISPPLSRKEKRKLYKCGDNFVTLEDIPTWDKWLAKPIPTAVGATQLYATIEYKPHSSLNKKVSLWHGDVTRLEVDAIVNPTVDWLLHVVEGALPNSVHAAVHDAAGPMLEKECQLLPDCQPGEAVITNGYNLPAKFVIHVVGSHFNDKETLAKCYQSCLELALAHDIQSIAFCCIGTNGLGFPKAFAAHIALKSTRKWLEGNAEKVKRIIFCTYKREDWVIYSSLVHNYFPLQDAKVEPSVESSSKEIEAERERRKQAERIIEEREEQIHQLDEIAYQRRDRIRELEQSMHQFQQQIEEQRHEVHQCNETIHQRENRIQELEQTIAEFQQHEAELEQQLHQTERQVANSDRVFQDIFQRLLGQVPQSQPHWVVQRDEIQLTEEQLGAGGWAVVKVAMFRGQRVAAKCLHNQIISAHNIRLFTREMNMAAHARHPSLLQFIGATMDNNPIILTELMPTSLRRVLEEGNPLSHGKIVSIALDVARALNYLHLSSPDPIIHRDVSSANVLLKRSAGDSYDAKLSDYGSANFVRYATTVGPGNPLYSAPEVNDPKRHSPKMDVYSLGLLLVEMCSGELFDDHEELIQTRISADWPEMVAIIRPCIRQDPRRRPSTADIIRQLEHEQLGVVVR